MPARNRADLRTDIREIGSYENSSVFTDGYLNRALDKAMHELHALIVNANEDYYLTYGSVATVANQQHVDLPAGVFKVRAVARSLGGDEYVPLRRLSLPQMYEHGSKGTPTAYSYQKAVGGGSPFGALMFWPIPDAVYTIRLVYVPTATLFSDDVTAIDFGEGWDDYLIHAALLRCDMREERDLGDRMGLLQRYTEMVRASVGQRDRNEPEYLIPRRGAWHEEG